METVLIVLLLAVCAGLFLRLFAVERNLRGAARQLRRGQEEGDASRIRLTVPNPAAEELLDAVNALLEAKKLDAAQFRARDLALRRQIANVSHDLRTPLTSILGYLQLLEGDTLTPEERREYLAVIESRARALQALITAFYDLSRLEGGEYPLQMQPVDLRRVLGDLMAEFYDELEGAFDHVELVLAEEAPPVRADPAAASRIFTNLLMNAIQHGEGRLEVRLDRQGDFLVTSFANGAARLTREDAAHVFDRSFTADKTRTGGSTGLGLAIVKALTEQMGHSVSARWEDGVFTVGVVWKL